MILKDTQEPTSQHVADLATQRVKLPALALIGVFGNETNPAALIRGHNGEIQRINVGDTVAGSLVAAIDIDRVILAKGAQTKILGLPDT
ncbi:pilus assembly protein PilZ [Sulfitobacter sp. F26204]|uniref:pilus assembly protein PilZ n=1 Tax=Sulfitobacter sp. F26204 TaxID=2996014 RepID=UPI00225DE52E|nr:pilus assembly protein PilZ [Sulfitobacter sp. F26204]MCX7559464.1 pilus assembly protein PilZ [Sulfitobacter sp. F26204]